MAMAAKAQRHGAFAAAVLFSLLAWVAEADAQPAGAAYSLSEEQLAELRSEYKKDFGVGMVISLVIVGVVGAAALFGISVYFSPRGPSRFCSPRQMKLNTEEARSMTPSSSPAKSPTEGGGSSPPGIAFVMHSTGSFGGANKTGDSPAGVSSPEGYAPMRDVDDEEII